MDKFQTQNQRDINDIIIKQQPFPRAKINNLAARQSHIRQPAWQVLTKVPKLTIYFWIVKILTTAMGESTSDYLVHRFNPYLAVIAGFIVLVLVLIWQITVKRYYAPIYWLAAATVSVSGTMAADATHIALGVPYYASALLYAIILMIIFVVWYKYEKTLSIHSIHTHRRELFYWAVVLATFALGTATGDLTAYTMHLGYLTSGILFTLVFAVPALAYWLFRVNAVFAFWFAYIMTRPLGASFADWAAKPLSFGGLGFGDGSVSLVLACLIILIVAYLTFSHKDQQSHYRSIM